MTFDNGIAINQVNYTSSILWNIIRNEWYFIIHESPCDPQNYIASKKKQIIE